MFPFILVFIPVAPNPSISKAGGGVLRNITREVG